MRVSRVLGVEAGWGLEVDRHFGGWFSCFDFLCDAMRVGGKMCALRYSVLRSVA